MSRLVRRIVFIGVLCCGGLMSCSTRSVLRFEKFNASVGKGDYLSTIAAIKKQPKLYGKNNLFLYNIDVGALYQYAGLFDSSAAYLLKAGRIYDDLFTRSVTNEAASLLTNDNIRPYRSKPYEIVLLHQFLQLDYLSMGQPDEALVEARATQLLFNEWERKNAKENRYFTDGMFHYITSIVYDQEGQTDDAMISLYTAVRAFQQGPVALPPVLREYAGRMLEKNNRGADAEKLGIRPKAVLKNEETGFHNEQTEIIVVGYAGKGPALIENQWWGEWVRDGVMVLHHATSEGREETMAFPAPGLPRQELEKQQRGEKTKSGTTVFIKVALPQVKTFPSQTAFFTVRADENEPIQSYTINDLDKQAEKQLEDAKPSIIGRTVVRVVTRTIAAQEAKKRMETNSALLNLLINVGTDVVSAQLEKADTRSCFFIPKTIQIARIPVKPGNHMVTIEARDRNNAILNYKTFPAITLKPHEKRFVVYSSLR